MDNHDTPEVSPKKIPSSQKVTFSIHLEGDTRRYSKNRLHVSNGAKQRYLLNEAKYDDFAFVNMLEEDFPATTAVHVKFFCWGSQLSREHAGDFAEDPQVNKCIHMLAKVADRCTFSFSGSSEDDWRDDKERCRENNERAFKAVKREIQRVANV